MVFGHVELGVPERHSSLVLYLDVRRSSEAVEVIWAKVCRMGRVLVYLGLIHVDLWRKPTQHRKTIILQLKIIVKKPTSRREEVAGNPQPPSLRLTVFSLHVLSGHREATEQGWAPTG